MILKSSKRSGDPRMSLSGTQSFNSQPPTPKTMILKALHKYIRIYLYTYVSVQKPPKTIYFRHSCIVLAVGEARWHPWSAFRRRGVPNASVDEVKGYRSPLGTRIPLTETCSPLARLLCGGSVWRNTKADQNSLCPLRALWLNKIRVNL